MSQHPGLKEDECEKKIHLVRSKYFLGCQIMNDDTNKNLNKRESQEVMEACRFEAKRVSPTKTRRY